MSEFNKNYEAQTAAMEKCDAGTGTNDWQTKLKEFYDAKGKLKDSSNMIWLGRIGREEKWGAMDRRIDPAVSEINKSSGDALAKSCQGAYSDMGRAIREASGKDSHDKFATQLKTEAEMAKQQPVQKTADATPRPSSNPGDAAKNAVLTNTGGLGNAARGLSGRTAQIDAIASTL